MNNSRNQAANLIRQKITRLYKREPSARQELIDAKKPGHHSRHQKFVLDLSQSGKSLADIQVAWHNYYAKLSDTEKHQVWQEYYDSHHNQRASKPEHSNPSKAPSVSRIHEKIVNQVRAQTQISGKQHLKSLMFGVSMGLVAVVFILFGFFNERFVAPFITPSKQLSDTPIIVDPNDTSTSPDPRVVIPKINVDIPVVYDEPSIQEDSIQKALERGVVHYSTTSNPGEKGNTVIFGHSSNNIFNSGQYKFAFVLLSRLEKGDTFMLHKDGTRYVYKVFDKKVVSPTELSVLERVQGKTATASLITCDPPGTSINRLVIIGEQISPSPDENIKSTAKKVETTPEILPSNAPSLWGRFWNWLIN